MLCLRFISCDGSFSSIQADKKFIVLVCRFHLTAIRSLILVVSCLFHLVCVFTCHSLTRLYLTLRMLSSFYHSDFHIAVVLSFISIFLPYCYTSPFGSARIICLVRVTSRYETQVCKNWQKSPLAGTKNNFQISMSWSI